VHDFANNATRESQTYQASRGLSAIAELLVLLMVAVQHYTHATESNGDVPIGSLLYHLRADCLETESTDPNASVEYGTASMCYCMDYNYHRQRIKAK